ncbi:arginyl-tRNA synthetase, class Ic [Artemisia annua]|uniref:Arginyl-tRNA synthetase, class Ic n=1 Tax=Artemisia annua TaxID=35608 RepID=A0A2U1KC84_ARTAN|nr:arginyl-tRNA synthetase, class Ic [Artemisia annua]
MALIRQKILDYGCSPAEVDDYKAMLFLNQQPEGNDCSLEWTVDWKRHRFSERSIFDPVDEEDFRWSLQKEISLTFGYFVNILPVRTILLVSVRTSTGTEADDYDYLCTSVLNLWPFIRCRYYLYGPKHAGLVIKDGFYEPEVRMLERCVVGGPGFLKFKLSRTWIAKSKMMMTEFLMDRFPNGEVNEQAIGELEVLYEESKKRFAEDAEFRERTQPVQVSL